MQTQLSQRLYAISLLSLLGLIWGSGYSIAHYATTHGVHPLGYAFWQSLGPAVFLAFLYQNTGSRWIIHSRQLRFYLICGLIGIALPNTVMYFAAPHLPAGILAVVVNTVPVMTYLVAWAFGEESFTWTRLWGVMACVAGLMILVIPQSSLPSANMVPWVLITLITPLCFALCAVYSSRYRPVDSSPLLLSAGMLIASTLFLTPVIIASHHFYPIWPPFQWRDAVVVLEMILSSIGYVVFFQLLKIAGAVYYSLVGGIVALTGLFWGWLFFNEQLTLMAIISVSLIIIGIVTVTLRDADKN